MTLAFHKSPYPLMMLIFTYILIGNPDGLAGLSVSKIPGIKPVVNPSSFQLALKFSLPSRGAPGSRSRKGAGVRGSCPPLANPEEELTALVPGTNLGLTVSERPTFWFYVPYSSNNHLAVEFSLQDRDGKNLLYPQNFPLAGTPGIVSIPLPETVSPLEVGKLYHWRFTVICDPSNRLDDLTVEGGVERSLLTPELKSRLEKATPRERIAIYAENGLWFDALTNLVELRRTKPQDEALQQDWADLWREVRLEFITNKPIVPCCSQERSQP